MLKILLSLSLPFLLSSTASATGSCAPRLSLSERIAIAHNLYATRVELNAQFGLAMASSNQLIFQLLAQLIELGNRTEATLDDLEVLQLQLDMATAIRIEKPLVLQPPANDPLARSRELLRWEDSDFNSEWP